MSDNPQRRTAPYKLAEVAEALNTSMYRVRRLVAEGALVAFQHGTDPAPNAPYYVLPEELEAYRQRVGSHGQ